MYEGFAQWERRHWVQVVHVEGRMNWLLGMRGQGLNSWAGPHCLEGGVTGAGQGSRDSWGWGPFFSSPDSGDSAAPPHPLL